MFDAVARARRARAEAAAAEMAAAALASGAAARDADVAADYASTPECVAEKALARVSRHASRARLTAAARHIAVAALKELVRRMRFHLGEVRSREYSRVHEPVDVAARARRRRTTRSRSGAAAPRCRRRGPK